MVPDPFRCIFKSPGEASSGEGEHLTLALPLSCSRKSLGFFRRNIDRFRYRSNLEARMNERKHSRLLVASPEAARSLLYAEAVIFENMSRLCRTR